MNSEVLEIINVITRLWNSWTYGEQHLTKILYFTDYFFVLGHSGNKVKHLNFAKHSKESYIETIYFMRILFENVCQKIILNRIKYSSYGHTLLMYFIQKI